MEKPVILIAGQKIEPAPPKMKVWRAFLHAAGRDLSNETLEHFMDAQVELIVTAFGKPEIVNKESIEENLEIAEVVPLVRKLFKWIQLLTFEKLADAPNVEAEKA